MPRWRAWVIAALALVFAAAARGGAPSATYGRASWYGWWHAGRPMANGHPFRPLAETAASLQYPLGTWIRITNLDNGRTVSVPVTDRGPYHAGRILDVSLGVARRLGMVEVGLARVRVEPISPSAHGNSHHRRRRNH